tara:strand:- start:84 stop:701 length:618 start_codon:yes stop_codon:yes gene_type:complete
MTSNQSNFSLAAINYLARLQGCFTSEVLSAIEILAEELRSAWVENRTVYICGNGGSAANAIHMANDFNYGIGACGDGPILPGLRVEALPSNSAVLTCLANDTGYENIFSSQLQIKGSPNDILIALSGSGNSLNIIKALEMANTRGLKSFAVLGYTGGRCLGLANVPIHFKINDMQIAEDTQLVVGHLCMQWLSSHKPVSLPSSNA